MTAEVLDQVRFEELEQPPWDGFAVFAAFGRRTDDSDARFQDTAPPTL